MITRRELPPALPRAFFDRDVGAVARDLLGCWLIRSTRRGIIVGRIVETEAYLPQQDPACHAARGKTPRNRVMFGPPGRAYVYSIHTRYCLNAVSLPRGVPSAVLIRAVEPLAGLALMAARRGTDRVLDLARGPGRLCEAFQIDRRLNDHDLTRGTRLWIAASPSPVDGPIASSPRIGISSAQDLLLRFFLDGCPFVSGPRHWHGRPVRSPSRLRVSDRLDSP